MQGDRQQFALMGLLLLSLASLSAQPLPAPANVSAADVVAAFQQLCLPEFPDTVAISSKAQSTGWTRVLTPNRPRHFKGMTFDKDEQIFVKSAFIATVGPSAAGPTNPSRTGCGVSAPLDDATLLDLSARVASNLKLPSTVPTANDNSVEWQFRDGRLITAGIINSAVPKAKGKSIAMIGISTPKADQ